MGRLARLAPGASDPVSTRTLSVVLHGQRWPDAAWSQSLRAVLSVPAGSGPASVIEVLEAREDAATPAGAAAALNRVVQGASGDLVLCIEAGCAWTAPLLVELITAAWQADVVAIARPDHGVEDPGGPGTAGAGGPWQPAWWTWPRHERDPITSLSEASRTPLEQWSAALYEARPRLLAVRRTTWRLLEGFDPELWSIGLIEDFAARAGARGIAVRPIPAPPPIESPWDAWPLRAHLRGFLTVRNALVSAATALDADQAGWIFGQVSAMAVGDAWRQAGIASSRLQFGGAWGRRQGFWTRSRGAAAQADAALTLANERGSLLPILALDAFLDVLVVRARPLDPAGLGSALDPVAASAGPDTEAGGDGSPAPDAGVATDRAGEPADGPAPPLPTVSVIVVNWNGKEHLDACFTSLSASDYPADRLETICVDNGSTDGSRELLAARFPAVRVVALPDNAGFTGGNEAGVAESRGDVLVFFNNDMRVAPGTVRALVAALDAVHPCAAAEVRSWDGRRIDFVRGTVNFEGWGFQDHYSEPWRPERAASADTFFPNGGAFAITREAYRRAGGFDETFFAYYDDIDLGFGVRANGGRIRVVHEAPVLHRHGATSRRYPRGQKRFLMERNALWTTLKRYEDATLERSFGALLLLAARRIAQDTRLRRQVPWVQALVPFSARARRRATGPRSAPAALLYDDGPTIPSGSGPSTRAAEPADARPAVHALPLESLAAAGEALLALPDLAERRRRCQEQRMRTDREILPELGRGLEYTSPLATYRAAQDALVSTLGLHRIFRGRARVLIITHEPLRTRMSGPGVRALELGRALSAVARVTVATPVEPEIRDPRCTLAPYAVERPASLRRLAEDADVLMVQGFTLTQFPFLISLHVPIVVDLYCPFTVEFLEMKAAAARARGGPQPDLDAQLEAAAVLEVQNAQLQHGDFFLCASERQRDFWLGTLHTAGRVNAATYAADATLRRLIDVVPFGVPEQDFATAAARARVDTGGAAMKGARPGIGERDKVLFWGGSLLDWQDPLTLIQAVARLAATRRDVKLFFAGTRHPNPQVAPMRVVQSSEVLARELGVLDTHVFFNDWIPYDQRAAYLAEADLGLSTHRPNLETHLSFRTRMLDYIWAELPIVCTEGDHFADLVQARGLGLAVPPGRPDALADAIARLLDDEGLRATSKAALRMLGEELRWSRVARPLRAYCAAPSFAADRQPRMRAIKTRLKDTYRVSKWVKRTALGLGVSEARFERIKQLGPVQVAMRLRNQIALVRATGFRGRS